MIPADKTTAVKKLDEIIELSIAIRQERSDDAFADHLSIEVLATQVQALILELGVDNDHSCRS